MAKDKKKEFCVDQDRLIKEVQQFAGQIEVISAAARGLARPLMAQTEAAVRRDRLRAEAVFGQKSEQAARQRRKEVATVSLRNAFEQGFAASLAEPRQTEPGRVGLFGSVTKAGKPETDVLIGVVSAKGGWLAYDCTDKWGNWSLSLPAGASGVLRVQDKSGAPLWQDTEALPRLTEGQSVRRDIELDARGVCPEPGPIDDDPVDDNEPEAVTVPDLKGQDEGAALAALRAAGLNRGSRTQEPSDATPNTVIDQDPNAGSEVEPGSAVDITVAEARQQVMPKVIDLPLSLARSNLREAGLSRITEKMVEVDDASGLVIEQSPQPGLPVDPETQVVLTIGQSAKRVMPRLIGEDPESSIERLHELGIETIDRRLRSTPDPASIGLVIGQKPDAGTHLTASSRVELIIGIEEIIDPEEQEMPDLVGEKLDSARERLAELNLRNVSFETAIDPDHVGLVVDQSPAPGTLVDPQISVVLVTGTSEETQRPDDIDPKRVTDIMAQDEALMHRGLSAEEIGALLARDAPLSAALLIDLSQQSMATLNKRLELGNRALAGDLQRALRAALQRR